MKLMLGVRSVSIVMALNWATVLRAVATAKHESALPSRAFPVPLPRRSGDVEAPRYFDGLQTQPGSKRRSPAGDSGSGVANE